MSPEAGHILPTIPVVRDLSARGHRVVYLTVGRIHEELNSLGIETRVLFSPEWPELASRSLFRQCEPSMSMFRALMRRFGRVAQFAASFWDEIRNCADAVQADLILVDGVHDEVGMYGGLKTKGRQARLHVQLPSRPPRERELAENSGTTIYLSPREFEIPGLLRAGVHYTEPGVYLQESYNSDFDWKALDANAPIVYCSLGGQVEHYEHGLSLFRAILEAAAAAPEYQFLVNGAGLHRQLPGLSGPNVFFAPFMRHPEALSRVSAVITHGGFGIVKECVWFAVPMLVCPQMWDQPSNAQRVAYHGLGINAGASVLSGTDILDAIRVLLSGRFNDCLCAMSSIFQKRQTEQRTARVCEATLTM
jgi:UDP:flavonoid glycosyltransferase YjiC (YdhE family)